MKISFIIGNEINIVAKTIYAPSGNLSSKFFFKNMHHNTAVNIIILLARKSIQNGINSVIFKIWYTKYDPHLPIANISLSW